MIQKEKLLTKGLQYTTAQKWAIKCPWCFVPQMNEQKANKQEPDFIVAMDGNFQQQHYAHASKDTPDKDQYPPSFLPPSLVNTRAAEVKATNSNVANIDAPCAESHKTADDTRDATTWEKCDNSGLFAGEWLHSKLKGAKSTVFEARKALAKLHLLHISSRNTGKRYTNTFFQEQWDNKQAYHLESNQSTCEKQEKELGRLLRLET
ncbi:hypothetical protein PCASD_09261 [Puccinia coronata f. sp. avenae]|uniref:Uncharacterized protein n=1 Tax=Puccinia coronata f. sp. avenae TaxID=200324 RepID=A0A2N5TFM5_9BASI|nr:hypothetical protein PCASD_09261 [Puccinia coronata f. sp. avenae]